MADMELIREVLLNESVFLQARVVEVLYQECF